MMNRKISKKGTILVPPIFLVMTIILFVVSLFFFATSYAKTNVRVADAGYLDSVYVQEDLINFYIDYSGKQAVKNLAVSNDNDITRIRFDTEFKKIIREYKFEDNYLIDFQERVKEGDFITFVDNGKIVFKMKIQFKEEDEGLKFTYSPVIVKEFDLK